jgi:anti-sigma regulatory factor (Ser/Thr protein kinase)
MPMTAAITIPADPQRLHDLRSWLAKVFADWGHDPYLGTLVLTGLATNALKHTESPEITVHAYLSDDGPAIEVWDSSPSPPIGGTSALESESGRGLEIVRQLSRRLGWNLRASGGKAVYVVLDPA